MKLQYLNKRGNKMKTDVHSHLRLYHVCFCCIDNKINDLPTHCSWKPITPDLNTMASALHYKIHLELKCWLDVL